MKRFLFRSWWALTLLAGATLVAPPSATANLLVNPGFEDAGGSYDGWFVFGTGPQLSLPAGDNIIRSGSAAAKIEGEFTAGFSAGGISQKAGNLTPGMDYVFSGFGYMSSGDAIVGTNTCDFNRLIAKIVFLDSGKNEIQANEQVIGDWNTPHDQWIPFSVSSPAPAGADSVRVLLLFLQPDVDPGAVYVDDVSLVAEAPMVFPNLLANPSFSTGTSGWQVFGNGFPESGSAVVHSRPGSGKLFGPFADPGGSSVLRQRFAATPGKDYHANLYSYTNCLDGITKNHNFSLAAIKFFAGGVAVDSAYVVVADSSSKPFAWTQYSLVANAPSGVDSVELALVFVQPNPIEGGAVYFDDVAFYELDPVSVELPARELDFALQQNAPNPFNPRTRIDFVLQRRDMVDITVYDVSGRRIANLVRQPMAAGRHSVIWDGRMSNGVSAGTGIYRYVMRTSAGQRSRNMTLIR